MTVWVDSDSCAREARALAARAASQRRLRVHLVGDRSVPEGKMPEVEETVVETGGDAADDYIVAHAEGADLVITRDLLLAERLTEGGVTVLNDSGEVYTRENIAERRSVRDFMYGLRQSGAYPERGRSRGRRETQAFANAFDRELTRRLNRS